MGVLTSIEGSNPSFSASLCRPRPLAPAPAASPCPEHCSRGLRRPRDTPANRGRFPGYAVSRQIVGGVAERSNAAVSKTVSGGFVRRGFKSLPLRLTHLQ